MKKIMFSLCLLFTLATSPTGAIADRNGSGSYGKPIEVYAPTYDSAQELADVIEELLAGKKVDFIAFVIPDQVSLTAMATSAIVEIGMGSVMGPFMEAYQAQTVEIYAGVSGEMGLDTEFVITKVSNVACEFLYPVLDAVLKANVRVDPSN